MLGVSRDAVGERDNAGTSSKPDDLDRPDIRAPHGSGSPSYTARVALDQTAIATENGPIPLGPGMAITAEIKTGQRRVIQYLLSSLVRYRQEGLRER